MPPFLMDIFTFVQFVVRNYIDKCRGIGHHKYIGAIKLFAIE